LALETIVLVLARSAHPSARINQSVFEMENWKNKYRCCPLISMLKQLRENNTISLKLNRYPIENTPPTSDLPSPSSGPDPFSVCPYTPSNEGAHGR
jgi:hypothetical protein